MCLINYIDEYFNNISEDEILLIIKTDLKGKIITWKLINKKLKFPGLKGGKELSEYFVAFEGMFATNNKEIILENINLENSFWINIYIKKTDLGFLVLLKDNSKDVLNIKDHIQKKNESELEKNK